MYTSANMGLRIWNLVDDDFDYTQLEDNFAALDQHNHAAGQGVQIPTGGLANAAVTTPKIATGAVTDGLVALGTLTQDRMANSAKRMSWTNQTGAYTAQPGDLVVATGGAAITLPSAAGNLDAMIGVIARSGTTGAAPVGIVSASLIKCVGFSTTALFLGAPFAYLILQSDSVSWRAIAGEQDTGWHDMTLGANTQTPTVSQGLAASARIIGDKVILRGGIGATGAITAGTAWATLPGAGSFSPPVAASGNGSRLYIPGCYISGNAHNYYIDQAGHIAVDTTAANADSISFNGAIYTLN